MPHRSARRSDVPTPTPAPRGPARAPGAPAPGDRPPSRAAATVQALVVTFLWSTSWVLITLGLDEVPALTFAGLRYALAVPFLIAPALARPAVRRALRAADGRAWGAMVALGVLHVAVAQGAQFLGLALLPTLAVSLALAATPLVVGLAGWAWLGERPGTLAWAGIALFLLGAATYLTAPAPARAAAVPPGDAGWPIAAGAVVLAVGVAANAAGTLLGRGVARRGTVPPLGVTAVSMAVGAAVLLPIGLLVQGLPAPSWRGAAVVVWLAIVNTAFAFTLWNRALRALDAVTASLVNNTMLIQIALLAWAFLGERPSPLGAVGLAAAAVGVALHQVPWGRLGRRSPGRRPSAP